MHTYIHTYIHAYIQSNPHASPCIICIEVYNNDLLESLRESNPVWWQNLSWRVAWECVRFRREGLESTWPNPAQYCSQSELPFPLPPRNRHNLISTWYHLMDSHLLQSLRESNPVWWQYLSWRETWECVRSQREGLEHDLTLHRTAVRRNYHAPKPP